MPNIPTLPYHEFPDLHLILDLLGRCEANAHHMTAWYQDQGSLQAGVAACRRWDIHCLFEGSDYRHGNADGSQHLRLSCSDWHALAKNVLSMLATELGPLFHAATHAARILPLPWHGLSLPDHALAAWGRAEGMVALPLQDALVFLKCRYPATAPQRRQPARIDDAGEAGSYRSKHALGFMVAAQDGADYLACHPADWCNEVASSNELLRHHLALTLKIGFQLLATGDASPLPAMFQALACAGETPLLLELKALLQTYRERVELRASAPDPLIEALLHESAVTYREWQPDCILTLPCTLRTAPENSIAPAADGVGTAALPGDPDWPGPWPPITGERSAFQRVEPLAPATDIRASARKRVADPSLGGDMKRPCTTQGRLDGASSSAKVGPVLLIHAEVASLPEQPASGRIATAVATISNSAGRTANCFTRVTMPAYRPLHVWGTERHGDTRGYPDKTRLAGMPGPPAHIFQKKAEVEGWRRSLVTTTLFEPRMYTPPGHTPGVSAGGTRGPALGASPATVQTFPIPVCRKTGFKI